jgi:hypothetical protein
MPAREPIRMTLSHQSRPGLRSRGNTRDDLILGDLVGKTAESPGSNAAGQGVMYALEYRQHPAEDPAAYSTEVQQRPLTATSSRSHEQPMLAGPITNSPERP